MSLPVHVLQIVKTCAFRVDNESASRKPPYGVSNIYPRQIRLIKEKNPRAFKIGTIVHYDNLQYKICTVQNFNNKRPGG